MTVVFPSLPYFTDNEGNALENAQIYVGTAGLDARSNPIATYWDEDATIPATQPIRTSAGFPVRTGAATAFYTAASTFSLTVLTEDGSPTAYTNLQGPLFAPSDIPGVGPIINQFLPDKAALAALAPTDGDTARIVGGGGDWVFTDADKTAEVAVDDYEVMFVAPDSSPTGADGAWVRQITGTIYAEWAGPFTDPTTNHLRIQSVWDLTEYVDAQVVLPNETIEWRTPVATRDNLRVVGSGPNSELFFNANPNTPQGTRTGIWLGIANAALLTTNDNTGLPVYMTWETGEGWTSGTYMLSVGDASAFSAGDKVFVRSRAYYVGGGSGPNDPMIPHFGQPNKVQFSDGGTGAITQLAITAAGAGYVAATTTVSFSGGGGSGAAATAIVSSTGTITGLILTNRGTGYSSAPTVTITGAGAGATATAAVATDFLIFDYPLMGDVPYDTAAVEDAVDNGGGLIRITITGHGFTDYNPVLIDSVGGVPNADGEWAITVINADTFDLIGSTFAGLYTSGGTVYYGGSRICNATQDNVTDPISGRIIGPVENVQFSGFKVRAATGNLAFSRTCPLNCNIAIDIDAPEGFWFNSTAFSKFSGTWRGYRKAIEMALNCTCSQYSVRAEYRNVSTFSNDPILKLGECSNYNVIDLWLIGDFNGAGDGVVEFDNGTGNVVNIHSLNVPSHTSNILVASNPLRASAVDPLEIQEANADNVINVMCPVYCGAPARFILTDNDGGRLSNFTVNGGQFYGTPATAAVLLPGDGVTINGCWFESGNINTTGGTNLRMNYSGSGFSYTGTGHFLEWVVNGVPQRAQGELISTSAISHQLDMSIPQQTITFSGATFELGTPINSIIGSTTRVTLTNASGGGVTPTAVANYFLTAGGAWAAIDDTESITFDAQRMPAPSGTRVVIFNISPSVP